MPSCTKWISPKITNKFQDEDLVDDDDEDEDEEDVEDEEEDEEEEEEQEQQIFRHRNLAVQTCPR